MRIGAVDGHANPNHPSAFTVTLRAPAGISDVHLMSGRAVSVPMIGGKSHSHIYGWFTEGFDTLDLKEARALLDELHAD